MTPEHLQFARRSLTAFIDAAIQRFAFSGENLYRYNIAADEIKNAAGLARLKRAVVDDYIAFFKMNGVRSEYNEAFEVLSIALDLNSCVLSPNQSDALSLAMTIYRTENL